MPNERPRQDLTEVLDRFGMVRASEAIMALMGGDCGDVRLPLRPLHGGELSELHELVGDMEVFARPLGTPAELGR